MRGMREMVKKKSEFKYNVVENWLRSTSEEALEELKQKCQCYRSQTGNNEYYPYEAVVWVYNKGPQGRRMSYESIAKELGITPTKAHESKWIGLLLLGYRGAEHPARTRRIAEEIERCWQEHQKHLKKNKEKQIPMFQPEPEKTEVPVSKNLEEEIIETARVRQKILSRELREIYLIKESLEKELREWEVLYQIYKQLFQIEKEEEEIVNQLRKKNWLRNWKT